jgi:hypothetical protein
MSIDLSNVVGISDERGKIVQIADESGRVIWAVPREVTLEITTTGHEDYSYVTVDGVKYYTAGEKVSLPARSPVICFAGDPALSTCYISVNGKKVTESNPSVYLIRPTRDLRISPLYLNFGGVGSVFVSVLELFKFKANGQDYVYTYERSTWSSWSTSAFNTTGMSVVSVTDANGNSVSLDSVIEENGVYTVEFASKISFTVAEGGGTSFGTVTYQADDGMTWGEWVNSKYNDDGSSGGHAVYSIDGDMIRHNEQGAYVCLSDWVTFQRTNMPIVADTTYVLQRD